MCVRALRVAVTPCNALQRPRATWRALLPCLQRALRGAAARGGGVLRLRVPAPSALGDLLLFAGPGFFALLGKVVCYSSMSYAAAACGTVALAAHQV